MATDEQIESSINKVFAQYTKVPKDALVRAVMHDLHVSHNAAIPYGTTYQKVSEYIDSACLAGKLGRMKGMQGGIMRHLSDEKLVELDKQVNKLVASVEKPCKQCSRNNTIGDRKCWWCECPNPTS